MTEPLSSHEIEDVLSSIRRLVSEELRPAPRGPGAEAAVGVAADVPAEPAAPMAAAAPVTAAPTAPPTPHPTAPVAPPRAEAGKLILTPSLRVVGEDWPGPAAPEPEPASKPGVDPVLLHEGLAPPAPEPEPDFMAGARAGGPLLDYEEDLVWATPGEPDPAPAAPVPPPEWLQSPGDWADDEVRGPVPFATHRRPAGAPDPLARAWADRAEAEVRAELEEVHLPPPLPAAEGEPAAALFEPGEAVIDEDALRDLVREIIREELAGTLGERITRNVRKLVRIEINRARAAREFD